MSVTPIIDPNEPPIPDGLRWYSKTPRKSVLVKQDPVRFSVLTDGGRYYYLRLSLSRNSLDEIGWDKVEFIDVAYHDGMLYIAQQDEGEGLRVSRKYSGNRLFVQMATHRLHGWKKEFDYDRKSEPAKDAWYNEKADLIVVQLWE